MKPTIILNCASRPEEAQYGFLSWLLQDFQSEFEVLLNLFGQNVMEFNKLKEKATANAMSHIYDERPCKFFNISAANNLGAVRAKGDLLIFANSDIVHPSFFLRELVSEFERANLHYAICNRINLTDEEVAEFRNPGEYGTQDNFDFICGMENSPGRWKFYRSPWVIRKDAFWAVGGFDNHVYCHEDEDITARLDHYLKRNGLQVSHHILATLHGYHLNHPASDLFNVSDYSKQFYVPRMNELNADPKSTADIVANDLGEKELLRLTCDVMPPVSRVRSGLRKIEFVRRLVKAGRAILRG